MIKSLWLIAIFLITLIKNSECERVQNVKLDIRLNKVKRFLMLVVLNMI